MNCKNFLIGMNVCLLVMVAGMVNNVIEHAAKVAAFEDCRAKHISIRICKENS